MDDCLLDLRSYHSASRKAHLSLDIALGLEAIHACGLVHGDIKPSNIIIQQHESRTVIAKLTDFNGVSTATSYGKTYTFGTPEWQSPEVLTEQKKIDWQRADVYSFAMVVATIWSRRSFICPGGSFIDAILGMTEKFSFEGEARRLRVNLMKFLPDSDEGSVFNLASVATKPLGNDEDEYASAALVIQHGLRRNPTDRLTMEEILTIAFGEFCWKNGRNLP